MEEVCTPQDKTFKILSIDGGGIKGLYSLAILNVLEKHFEVKLHECFDLICGTSTGGLIALALSIGMSAEDLANIYKEKASIIFAPPQNVVKNKTLNKMLGMLKQGIIGKYGNEGLKEVLNDIFHDLKMQDAKTNLCIPTTNLTASEPVVFKKGHCKGHTRDPQIPMKEVALATTAAPTYFEIAKIDSLAHDFIDGGLWANDPTLIGLIEAVKIFVGADKPYKNIEILSIASVSANLGKMIKNNGKNSYLSWGNGKDLIEIIMQLQTKSTQHYINHLGEGLPYEVTNTRIPEPKLSPKQAKELEIDSIEANQLKTLESLGSDMGYKWVKEENIKELFTQKVTK